MGLFQKIKELFSHEEPAPVANTFNVVSTKNPIRVKIIVNTVHIRRGPALNFPDAGVLTLDTEHTITEISNGFGRLKDGRGWILLEGNVTNI